VLIGKREVPSLLSSLCYSSCFACHQSVRYLGRLGEDEDGEEVEVIDAVTCKRCRQPWRVRLYAKVLSITSSSSTIKISAVLVATALALKAH
jgi:hypothetical protein